MNVVPMKFYPKDLNRMTTFNDLQRRVTQACETETPFKNAFWDNKSPGIYVDIVSGEPLFSSTGKYDSGTGWPSFTKPLENTHIVEQLDSIHSMTCTEVRSTHGGSHLGHVFINGVTETGLRHCINSASLGFILKVKLVVEEDYGEDLSVFGEDV